MKGAKPQLVVDNGAPVIAHEEPAPDWMNDAAQAEWRRIMPEVVERGALTDLDRGTFENYCVAVGRVRQFEAMLKSCEAGDFLKISRAQAAQINQAKQLAAELGLTPMGRSRKPMRGAKDDGGGGGDLFSLLDL